MKVVQLFFEITDDNKLKGVTIQWNETDLPSDKTLLRALAEAILDDIKMDDLLNEIKKTKR